MSKIDHKIGQVFLVGGAVRDELLGIEPTEHDWVVVNSSREKMLSEGFTQVGKDFPVFLHPNTREEYALARQERKTGQGHTEFTTHTEQVSLEEDLLRRDLSINAIAKSGQGDLIDPYGGTEDLNNRVLRHVSDAFSEDPLRVLRVARFMAQLSRLDFEIAPETIELMKAMSSGAELSTLAPERVWRETEKALESDKPSLYFESLRKVGALRVLFPEIDCLFGIPQRPEFHPEIDTGVHTMLSLDRICELSDDPVLRFAALTHDLGKGTTPKDLLPSHRGHELRSAELTRKLCARLRIPNAYKKLAVIVAEHHLLCHKSLRLAPKTLENLLGTLGAWKDEPLVKEFALCCMADARGRTGLENRPYPQVEFLMDCAQAAKNIGTENLRAQGFSGKELGSQIRSERARLLEPVIEKYAEIDELKYAKV